MFNKICLTQFCLNWYSGSSSQLTITLMSIASCESVI